MPSADDPPRERSAWFAPRPRTVRTRVLTVMLTFMAAGLAITGVLAYVAQFRALEQRVEAELWQEYDELALIAGGEPEHETVDGLLLAATDSAAPSDNESVITFVDGRPRYQPLQQDFALMPDESAESRRVRDAILAEHRPGSSRIVRMTAHGRELHMLIASVTVAGDDAEGVFVVASDIGAQRRELWQSVGVYTAVSVLTLLVAGWVGFVITGRLLRPLGDLRKATGQVTMADLGYRVPVPDGRDDVAGLARNFNRMLDRIQEGVTEQRRFMSDVGHELRTPLTIVHGTLETTEVEDPNDVRESHQIALEELDRMGRVVGDLSELAASARPDYVRRGPLDMEDFARSAFARIAHIAERDWVLERTVDVVADADGQRLMQAVVQLAANAVRYSDEGSTIRFGVDRVLGPHGAEIHVALQDEGVGIAPQDQQRIFERFTRVDGDRGSGSGLGLPIVQAIAEGHGGTVRLLSASGKGSVFTLVFPQFVETSALSGPRGRDGHRFEGSPPQRRKDDTEQQGRDPADDQHARSGEEGGA